MRAHNRAALTAPVQVHTGVFGHRLGRPCAARRAGEHRLPQDHDTRLGEARTDLSRRGHGARTGTVAGVSSAPVELVSLLDHGGRMSARREGEPAFTGVEGVADAIMAALARGVDLVVPRQLFEETRDAFPPELPSYIKVR
jgi:hypothetical protein